MLSNSESGGLCKRMTTGYEFWYQIKIDSRKGRRARLTFKRVITLCPSMLEIIARQSVITLSYFEAIWILGGRAIVGRGNWKSKVCANTKQSTWTDSMLARTKTNILSDSIALLGSAEDLAKNCRITLVNGRSKDCCIRKDPHKQHIFPNVQHWPRLSHCKRENGNKTPNKGVKPDIDQPSTNPIQKIIKRLSLFLVKYI